MSTIKDVAKKANVSIATVSRVINGLGGVKPDTEKRILKAIKEMNYSPNHLARSMVKKRTDTIGVIVPDIANPFFPEVIKGIEVSARKHGFTTFLANSNESVEEESRILNVLRKRRVDGLIVTTSNELESPLLQFEPDDIPIVLLDRDIEGSSYDSVVIDNVGGAYAAVKHLITEGHCQIGLIAGPSSVTPGRDRTKGYLKALKDFGIQVNPDYIREGDFKEESGYRLGSELLSMPTPPTAIFSCNNLMTLGLLKYIQDQGLRLKEDVTVIGFDDLDIANFIKPPLTVVSRPMRYMGEIAANLLIERINGLELSEPRKIVLVPQLLIRET
jgi:LacI family transcriptional regulator